MNRNVTLISLIIIILLTACGTEPMQATTQLVSTTAIETVQPAAASEEQPTVTIQTPSCAQPTAEMAAECEAEAAQILGSTVRITIRKWIVDENGNRVDYLEGGIGHATVKDGRYLVTHNHFSIDLLGMQEQTDGQRVEISVTRADTGEQILQELPLTSVDVLPNGPESLMLDFKVYGEMGLLEMMGVSSAQFGTMAETDLQPGDVVAQVNWDGSSSFVEWVPVEQVMSENDTAALRLVNGLLVGASGGGVFYNGVHLGNNWSTSAIRDQESGEQVGAYSTVALNISTTVVELAADNS